MKTDLRHWALEVIQASRVEFATVAAVLTTKQCEQQGEQKRWSPKDEFAHLSFWLEVFLGNIRAKRKGQPLTDTRDYLAMNDAAWATRKNWSWQKIKTALENVFKKLEREIGQLSTEELSDAKHLALTMPRPLLRDLTYELIDHPMHHFAGLYRKLGKQDKIEPMRARLLELMAQRGVARWSASTRRKIAKLNVP